MKTMPKWMLGTAEFLLRRRWGRKVVLEATEYVVRRKVEALWRATREGLRVAPYFVVGLIDAWLHPARVPSRVATSRV